MNVIHHRKIGMNKKKSSFISLYGRFIVCFVVIIAVAFYLLVFIQSFETLHKDKPQESAIATTPLKIAKKELEYKATIGYAVSITSCSDDQALLDAAAVLKHSIHMNSIQTPMESSLNPTEAQSKYNYEMVAIIHPDAIDCIASDLDGLGYHIYKQDIPVPVKDIKGNYLREKVSQNGCCGEKEFIKLWAYGLLQYPIIVHLDLDTVVLKPMDPLFDAMLSSSSSSSINVDTSESQQNDNNIARMWSEKPLPSDIQAYFTRDYNMANPSNRKKKIGIQGGFLVVKPNSSRLDELKEIIKTGDFRPGTGWGGLGFGPFYGAMTFQGIIPYFYDAIHPDTAVELNRCIYNNMADNPRVNPTVNDVVSGLCRDGRDDCEDCREINADEVVTAHFTLCQKPWLCMPHDQNMLQHRLCRVLHRKWFQVRYDLEKRKKGKGTYDVDQFFGYCNKRGKQGYIPININYLKEMEMLE